MKRIASLMALVVFVAAAIAVVSPADARPRRARRACQNCAPQQYAAPCFGGAICLQYLVYEDEEIAMWLVDHFSDTVCEGDPVQEFVFTAPGEAAPQSCGENAFPQCTGDGMPLVGNGLRGTAMNEPLGRNNADNYVKKLTDDNQTVKYPRISVSNPNNLDTVWHPHSAARELQFQFVKARKEGGGWVVIRLATGFVMMEDIDFVPDAKPILHKKPHRNFDFGLESVRLPANVPDTHIVTPTKWDKYSDSKTAFIVKFRGVKYHVLTQNPVLF